MTFSSLFNIDTLISTRWGKHLKIIEHKVIKHLIKQKKMFIVPDSISLHFLLAGSLGLVSERR